MLEALWLISITWESFSPKELALRKDKDDNDVWTEDVTEQLLKGHFAEMALHPEFITMEDLKLRCNSGSFLNFLDYVIITIWLKQAV